MARGRSTAPAVSNIQQAAYLDLVGTLWGVGSRPQPKTPLIGLQRMLLRSKQPENSGRESIANARISHEPQRKAVEDSNYGKYCCGRYWDRTSDLFRVREARYRCANRPYLVIRGGDGIRTRVNGFAGRCLASRPHHRRKALPPDFSERMTRFELATLTLAR